MKPSTSSLRFNNYQYFAIFTSSILFFAGYNIHFFYVVVGLRIISSLYTSTGISKTWTFSYIPKCHSPNKINNNAIQHVITSSYSNSDLVQISQLTHRVSRDNFEEEQLGFPGSPVVENPPVSAGDRGSIPGLERFHN